MHLKPPLRLHTGLKTIRAYFQLFLRQKLHWESRPLNGHSIISNATQNFTLWKLVIVPMPLNATMCTCPYNGEPIRPIRSPAFFSIVVNWGSWCITWPRLTCFFFHCCHSVIKFHSTQLILFRGGKRINYAFKPRQMIDKHWHYNELKKLKL